MGNSTDSTEEVGQGTGQAKYRRWSIYFLHICKERRQWIVRRQKHQASKVSKEVSTERAMDLPPESVRFQDQDLSRLKRS